MVSFHDGPLSLEFAVELNRTWRDLSVTRGGEEFAMLLSSLHLQSPCFIIIGGEQQKEDANFEEMGCTQEIQLAMPAHKAFQFTWPCLASVPGLVATRAIKNRSLKAHLCSTLITLCGQSLLSVLYIQFVHFSGSL